MNTSGPLPWQTAQWQRLVQQYEQGRLSHAYLLTGEAGLGKLEFALAAARYLICSDPQDASACGRCRSCQLFSSGTNPDLLRVGPEEGSQVLKIDQVRALADFAFKTGYGNQRKVIVLEAAHQLNLSAANALLKTLEEPPEDTVLILLSDMPGRLLATLRSRCQRVPFTVPDQQLAAKWLHNISTDETDIRQSLELAGGRPMLALTLLKGDGLNTHRRMLQALLGVLEGRIDPQDLAAKARDLGAATSLEILWRATCAALKAQVTVNLPQEMDPDLQAILQFLSGSRLDADQLLGRLLQMNQAADEARRHVSGVSNPNPLLVLESILWRWSRLAA